MSTLKIQRLQKTIEKLESYHAIKVLEHESEMNRLNENWGMKFSLIIKLFETALDDAGTLGEAKRWFYDWTKDINSMDANNDNEIKELLDKHGFEFDIKAVDVSYKDMI